MLTGNGILVKSIPPEDWPKRWPQVHFDEFNDIDNMRTVCMDAFNDLCDKAMRKHDWTYGVNDDFRPGGRATGQHHIGNAIDAVFFRKKRNDVPVWEQFTFAVDSHIFTRVGFYPFWNSPGLHLDLKNETLYWYRNKSGLYVYAHTPDELKDYALAA